MSQNRWSDVDQFFADQLIPSDEVLDAASAASAAAGLPAINVAPNQGKLLHLLARIQGARTVWRSARSAATAPSGWPGRCPRAAG